MFKTSLVSALAAACWLAACAVPLAASPQAADAPGVTVNLNGSLMHRSAIAYPRDALRKGVQGTVVVQVKLDSGGEVSDVVVLSGPEELRKTVIQAVLTWHFMKDDAGATRTINVDFVASQDQPATQPAPAAVIAGAVALPPSGSAKRTLKAIEVTGLSSQARDEVLARLPVHAGDAIGPDQVLAVIQAAAQYDSHLSATFGGTSSEAKLYISVPGAVSGLAPKPEHADSVSASRRIVVGSSLGPANLISQARPEYPPLARQSGISGVVRLSATIGKDGRVRDLKVVKGDPLLVEAALDAVRQWIYQPTLLNGEPVEVSTTIDVPFTLAQ